MDANDRSCQFPFLDNNFLYNEWCRLFDVPSEVLPVLVAIPRGASGTAQVMTALMYELDDNVVGIRWLHCQVVDGAA
ncbi:hypothetical protein FIBSPDRAFT_860503 [Athelia psychrophila]|uniref:Uncharacterized protein n=1 Tax=Athelia psychrophila TaxID=1759441 RepID=A0A166K5S2_9AGAM|nr:hypothetical protein FIBSPDRAFT_860503 [Fibularhizoctonia sp. CBS 109695]